MPLALIAYVSKIPTRAVAEEPRVAGGLQIIGDGGAWRVTIGVADEARDFPGSDAHSGPHWIIAYGKANLLN